VSGEEEEEGRFVICDARSVWVGSRYSMIFLKVWRGEVRLG